MGPLGWPLSATAMALAEEMGLRGSRKAHTGWNTPKEFLYVPAIEQSEKVASDLGLGFGFHRVLMFPPPVITG